MAQNRRTVSKFEFNKRIRDLVSRDSNQLRQTFQKFDKEYATRLAEIHSMQEKARNSMRNLAKDKIQAQLRSEEEDSLTRRKGDTSTYTGHTGESSLLQLNGSRKALTPEGRRKFENNASLPTISVARSDHLQVPISYEARTRRHSVPHRPIFPSENPKDTGTFPKAYVSFSPSKEAFTSGPQTEASPLSNPTSSLKQRSRGTNLQKNKNGYRLSIHDLPTSSSRSDNLLNVRKKSPQLYRRSLKTSDAKEVEDKDSHNKTNNGHNIDHPEKSSEQNDSKLKDDIEDTDPSSSHFTVVMEIESPKRPDNDNFNLKSPVKRTRSSSLPVDPTLLKGLSVKESHPDVPFRSQTSISQNTTSSEHVLSSAVKEEEPGAAENPFDELSRCRYLRSGDNKA
ncbi:uncharacterized protein [Montipora capricornis]|uniref:uncharacterized protein n=1 Tax=Montipora capricornis TaxID=246305 RepID=UPI0035F1914E